MRTNKAGYDVALSGQADLILLPSIGAAKLHGQAGTTGIIVLPTVPGLLKSRADAAGQRPHGCLRATP